MTAASLRRDPGSAVTAIADFARSLDVIALVIIETVGLSAMLIIYGVMPRRWPWALPCLAVACFGLWGVCDRKITTLTSHRQKSQRRILRLASRSVAAIGFLAALLGVYLFIGWTMGVYIS